MKQTTRWLDVPLDAVREVARLLGPQRWPHGTLADARDLHALVPGARCALLLDGESPGAIAAFVRPPAADEQLGDDEQAARAMRLVPRQLALATAVCSLSLTGLTPAFGQCLAAALGSAPHVRELRVLRVRAGGGPDALRALARCSALRLARLERLALIEIISEHDPAEDVATAATAMAAALPESLEALDLSFNWLTHGVSLPVVALERLPRLRRLRLIGCDLAASALRVATAAASAGLEALDLGLNALVATGAPRLALRLASLRELRLAYADLDDDDVVDLAHAIAADGHEELRLLHLQGNLGVRDAAGAALVGALMGRAPRLEELRLGWTRVGALTGARLAAWPVGTALARVCLEGTRVRAHVREQVRDRLEILQQGGPPQGASGGQAQREDGGH